MPDQFALYTRKAVKEWLEIDYPNITARSKKEGAEFSGVTRLEVNYLGASQRHLSNRKASPFTSQSILRGKPQGIKSLLD